MAETMRAIGSFDGLPVSDERCLVDVELPVPQLRPQDVLVRVQAVSVNPVDVKLRASLDGRDTPTVLGYDAAGVVEAIGASGDARSGSATRCSTPATSAGPVPTPSCRRSTSGSSPNGRERSASPTRRRCR